jgi:hypothetical protein
MGLLTTKQKLWFLTKTIKVGGFYSFPPMGFTVYSEPNYSSGLKVDTNPFTKSLDGEFFLVKEITNGFCKGNFYENPKGPDIYLTEDELSRRGLIEMLLLFLITSIPLIIYNRFKK